MIDETECAALESLLAAEPTNLAHAWRYWRHLGDHGGSDIRSGGCVVHAFRAAALASPEGAAAFAQAYHELFALSGEGPRRGHLDRQLRLALQRACRTLRDEDRRLVEWVLACVLPPSPSRGR